MPKKKKKNKGWENSNAKAELYAAILANTIPLDPPDEETEDDIQYYFDSLPEVTLEGDWAKFPRRLSDLRAQMKRDLSRANEDQDAFDRFVANHPKNLVAAKGNYSEWEGDAAQKLLKEDMAAGLHDEYKPKDLWESRDEYQLFPLKVFRDHIYQELRTARYLNQLQQTEKWGHKWKQLYKEMQGHDEYSSD